VALSVEKDMTYRQVIEASRVVMRETIADGIVAAAREIAEATNIKAIVCFSQTGNTAALVARERPRVPILALTPLMSTARRMSLTWGLHCAITEPQDRFKGAVLAAVKVSRDDGFTTAEDMIVVTAGVPFNVKGTTNILRVAPCDERLISRADPE
jgi:pyruvate kinase